MCCAHTPLRQGRPSRGARVAGGEGQRLAVRPHYLEVCDDRVIRCSTSRTTAIQTIRLSMCPPTTATAATRYRRSPIYSSTGSRRSSTTSMRTRTSRSPAPPRCFAYLTLRTSPLQHICVDYRWLSRYYVRAIVAATPKITACSK